MFHQAKFTKSNRPREPEVICSMSTIADTLDNYVEDKEDFVKSFFKVAKVIRSEIINESKWTFTGTFSDYKHPELLSMLLK